jgi:hypothetical protein
VVVVVVVAHCGAHLGPQPASQPATARARIFSGAAPPHTTHTTHAPTHLAGQSHPVAGCSRRAGASAGAAAPPPRAAPRAHAGWGTTSPTSARRGRGRCQPWWWWRP